MLEYQYMVVRRKPGRAGGVRNDYYELEKAVACKERWEKEGFIVTTKVRVVGPWEEVRNLCLDGS